MKYMRLCVVACRYNYMLVDPWRVAYLDAWTSHMRHSTVEVGTDAVIEWVNLQSKEMIPVGQRNARTIRSEVPKINIRLPLKDVMEEHGFLLHAPVTTMQKSSKAEIDDREEMRKKIVEWFSEQWNAAKMTKRRAFNELFPGQATDHEPTWYLQKGLAEIDKREEALVRTIKQLWGIEKREKRQAVAGIAAGGDGDDGDDDEPEVGGGRVEGDDEVDEVEEEELF